MAVALMTDALTTLEDARDWLGETTTDNDELIRRLINTASSFVLRKTGIISQTTITEERVMGSDDVFLLLKHKPIISVSEVLQDGSDDPITDYELTDDDKIAGRLYREEGWGTKWLTTGVNMDPYRNIRKYKVTYDAGYILPGDGARTLPWDLEQIVLDLIALKYGQQQFKTFGIKQLKQGKRSITYSDYDLTQEQNRVLDGYKKLVL